MYFETHEEMSNLTTTCWFHGVLSLYFYDLGKSFQRSWINRKRFVDPQSIVELIKVLISMEENSKVLYIHELFNFSIDIIALKNILLREELLKVM